MTRINHLDALRGPAVRVATVWTLLLVCCLGTSASVRAQDKPSPNQELLQRIEQLEEQIVDMQVVIGTLQSLPRGGNSFAPAQPAGGQPVGGLSGGAGGLAVGGASDGARLDGMETQIGALSAQVAQLAQQMRSLKAGGVQRGAVEGAYPQQRAETGAPVAPAGRPPVDRRGETGAISGFGSTTIQPSGPAGGDSIEGFLQEADVGQSMASLDSPAEASQSDPKKLYETAYGYLLQQQYGAAKTAFQDFLKTHPKDQLAGNAQYWLGESYYVQGQYKSAASAFLKGYETYAKSNKAPDSLLKLAMSLERLGQKDAACSSLAELTSRFPRAPVHVKKRADTERKRVGC